MYSILFQASVEKIAFQRLLEKKGYTANKDGVILTSLDKEKFYRITPYKNQGNGHYGYTLETNETDTAILSYLFENIGDISLLAIYYSSNKQKLPARIKKMKTSGCFTHNGVTIVQFEKKLLFQIIEHNMDLYLCLERMQDVINMVCKSSKERKTA